MSCRHLLARTRAREESRRSSARQDGARRGLTNVVVTAAHCLDKLADGTRPKPKIFVGPRRSAPRTSREAAEATTYKDLVLPDPQPTQFHAKDVGLVWLKRRVMEEAIIVRPVASTPTLGANQALGDAGWSDLNKDGSSNATYLENRTTGSLLGYALARAGQDPGEAVWQWTSTNVGTQHGDSGGALFIVGPGQRRDLIGVITGGVVDENRYTHADITASEVSTWLNTMLLDRNRVGWHDSNWYSFHAKDPNVMWYGGVDYTGTCRAGDSDCDHWFDNHDNCPNDYNPDQEVDAAGKGLACNMRSTLPFNPAYPTPAYKQTILGNCPVDSPDCPVGACYFTDVSGQFWEQQGTTVPYTQLAAYFGSYARIDTQVNPGRYTLIQYINPEVPVTHVVDEWFMPADVNMGCFAFKDLPGIPNPEQCTITKTSIRGGGPNHQSSKPLPANSLSLLSGLIGNIGFPSGQMPYLRVSNWTTSANSLEQKRGTDNHTTFTGGAFSFSCPGYTMPSVFSKTVTANYVKTTGSILSASQSVHSACFITGLGGAWALGKEGRTLRKPRAYIHEKPEDGSRMLTVEPGVLANGTVIAAEATASCLSW